MSKTLRILSYVTWNSLSSPEEIWDRSLPKYTKILSIEVYLPINEIQMYKVVVFRYAMCKTKRTSTVRGIFPNKYHNHFKEEPNIRTVSETHEVASGVLIPIEIPSLPKLIGHLFTVYNNAKYR